MNYTTPFRTICFAACLTCLITMARAGEMHPPDSCALGDRCEDAIVLPAIQSDSAFSCFAGCNLNVQPESNNNPCGIGDFPTVWYRIDTDGAATLMNIVVSSAEFEAPTINLFLAVDGCADLQPIGLTPSNLPCVVGSNGKAEAVGTDVGSSSTYYLAISSLNSAGGAFELCVNTIAQASSCVTDAEIEIISRSGSGPLEGPFSPGETIGICMKVNTYTAAANGCQWFHGIVPVFGNGWDPSSFDAGGQPLGATVNGNVMGVPENGLYGSATWDWFTDVGYHHDNAHLQVGDFDGNGTSDICHSLYDPYCPSFGGITGGCCGPCWDLPGDILPGGWFTYGIDGTCPVTGPPVQVDWGDGNSCGSGMGPWSFCFELRIRDSLLCDPEPLTGDLTVGFITFSDGETGSWTGGASVCAQDQPLFRRLPVSCPTTSTRIVSDLSDELFIFPNPAKDEAYVLWEDLPGEPVKLTIVGQSGVIVQTRALGAEQQDRKSLRIDMGSFPAGLYGVLLHTDRGIRAGRLIRN